MKSFESYFSKSGSSSGSDDPTQVLRKSAKSSGGLALTPIDNSYLKVQLEEQEADEPPSSGEDSPPKL